MGTQLYANRSSQQQIRSLLLVLLSAILSGCLILIALIHTWGSSGDYSLRDVLLDPELLAQLSYNEAGTSTKNSERLVFDTLQFKYFDKTQHRWKIVNVSKNAYEQLYTRISEDRSLENKAIFIISSQESTERGAAAISEERFSIDALRSRPIPDEIMKIAENKAPVFDESHASQLTILVKPSNGPSGDHRIFQEVMFSSEGNLYRVRLLGQKNSDWIYFEHPANRPWMDLEF